MRIVIAMHTQFYYVFSANVAPEAGVHRFCANCDNFYVTMTTRKPR